MNQHVAMPHAGPEDFGKGQLPPAFWLRSAALFVTEDRRTGAYVPSVDRIGDWLGRFDAWYKDTIGIENTDRLHLMYHRDISLVGDRFLDHVPELARLAEIASGLGVGFSVTVPLDEALQDPQAMRALIGCRAVSTLGVSIDSDLQTPDAALLASILTGIVAAKGHLAFIGDYDAIARLGLLDIPGVDSAQITIHPKSRGAHLHSPDMPVAPCFSRLRIYGDVDGSLYPCLGLVGVPGMALGHLDQPIEDTVLGGAAYPLRIDDLARRGPALTGAPPQDRLTGLPLVCEHHRRALLAVAGDDAGGQG
ncbi:hypothetical protein [Tropicibacter oceani]|uniref:Uncharacterized protein n=1 Tax=Tropicibacter oceani TaxID=3058420 RepID=A0ABY8QMY5_9RHOB|nr:hypothetical protein [Tropicibacter oceani]WGW05999.1 hypothetical protein QF118_19530 [Tropicibacter oceani]